MGSGDLSSNLRLGGLAPASAVREAEGQPAKQEDQQNPRRRYRTEEGKRENDDTEHREGEPLAESPTSEPAEQSAHQLDDLA